MLLQQSVESSYQDSCCKPWGVTRHSVYIYINMSKEISEAHTCVVPLPPAATEFGVSAGSCLSWLSSACTAHSVSYTDNLKRFKEHDGINPKWLGAKYFPQTSTVLPTCELFSWTAKTSP